MKTSKSKTIYRCQGCGHEESKWQGRCSECNAWNSFVEEISVPLSRMSSPHATAASAQRLSDVPASENGRISTGLADLDRLLGGGLVPGSLVLLGGSPGIGKSTLLLQTMQHLSRAGKALYVCGEESPAQVRMRAKRLGVESSELYLLPETNMEGILERCRELSPKFLVVDSIQTLYRADINSAAGSVAQVRECAALLMSFAKRENITVLLSGHVTKDGSFAGPRVLEHIVDSVFYFESERHQTFRILRAYKNRFGATDEIAIFEMQEKGLAAVANPSEIFLVDGVSHKGGGIVTAALEGHTPLLLEVQALVAPTPFGLPRRQVTGLDFNRAVMLIAVLERRAGISLGNQDVFLNAAGGLRLHEPAADLACALAMASARSETSSRDRLVAFGEVGLSGEVRPVTMASARLKEAARLGFRTAILPAGNLKGLSAPAGIDLKAVSSVKEAIEAVKR